MVSGQAISREEFSGVWVALVSPYNARGKSDDITAIRKLVNHVAQAGVRGVFILGTTGEGTLLSLKERKQSLENVLSVASGIVPVIVHTGHDRTSDVVDLSRHAEAAGAIAVAVAPPTRYKLDEEELRSHYMEAAQATGLPFFAYDIPGTTGNPLSAKLLTYLAHAGAPVVGAKISRADWPTWEEYLDVSSEFTILCGSDELALPLLAMGASGVVSSMSNIAPDLYVALHRAVRTSDIEHARILQIHINELCKVAHRGSPLAFVKEALMTLGLDCGIPRPPLRVLHPAERQQLDTELGELMERIRRLLHSNGG